MNQELVKETYLSVIDATVQSLQTEFSDKGFSETALERLEFLKERWKARLTQTHEFKDDPEVKTTSSSARGAGGGGKKKSKKKKSKANSNTIANTNANVNGAASSSSTSNAMSLNNLTNPPADDDQPLVPPSASSASSNPPPAKRARTEPPPPPPPPPRPPPDDDGGSIENKGEDLDSSDDSDLEGGESDEEAENLVLAQHDKVKKGNKWKITLRDGIVSIRGREYLFNKATCDLDF